MFFSFQASIFCIGRRRKKEGKKNLGWWSIELLQEGISAENSSSFYDGFPYINKVMFQDFSTTEK